MKFEANKEFMGNLSLQFEQTTDGGTRYLHVDVSLSWMAALGYILKTNRQVKLHF